MVKKFDSLDPVLLLKNSSKCQAEFWNFAWANVNGDQKSKPPAKVFSLENLNREVPGCFQDNEDLVKKDLPTIRYKGNRRTRKKLPPRTWRTRPDCFEDVWPILRQKLEFNPQETAKSLLDDLVFESPKIFNYRQLRTLQRRVAASSTQQNRLANSNHIANANRMTKPYLTLVLEGESGKNFA